MREPFGMIDRFLLTIGFEDECEALTILGVEQQTLLQLGFVAVGDEGDVMSDQKLLVTGLRAERPFSPKAAAMSKVHDVLPPDDGGQHRIIPKIEAGDEQLQMFVLKWMNKV